jgi:hypothetical protein
MNKILKILKVFSVILIGVFALMFFYKDTIYAYTCPSGTYCDTGGTSGDSGTYEWGCLLSNEYGCVKYGCKPHPYVSFTCRQVGNQCYGGDEYYMDRNCSTGVVGTYCCSDYPCGYTCTCPSGYTTTKPSGDSYLTASKIGHDRMCHSCTGTCYKSCPSVSCSDYEDPVYGYIWEDTESEGSRSATVSIPVPNPPSGCSSTQTKTCYTTANTQPTLDDITVIPSIPLSSLLFPSSSDNLFTEFIGNILAADPLDEVLGYTSDDHSGTELNNRVKVTATYTDTDGVDDIQAVYVWWSPESQIGLEESTDYLYPTSETGLSRYYPMDEASGTTVKDVASNTNATASGTTITTNGRSNNARSFDGSNDYISTGADIDYGTGTQITVSAWIKYTTCTGADGLCYVVSKNQYNSGTPYTLFVKTDGVIGFSVQATGTFAGGGYNDGNWHYIVGVLNGTTSYLYVDGEFKSSNTVSPISNNQYVIIGGDDAGPTYRPFNGIIDEVSIYNVALTDSQIYEKYELGYAEIDTTAITPNKIDTTKEPRTGNTSNFGLMVTKDGAVYVPHITSADDRVWTTPAFGGSGIYYISDPTPTSEHPDYDRMIELSNISVNSISSNQMELTAYMKFITDSNDKVSTHAYNLFGMANDFIGFTEYETDGIKDNNIWEDSTTDWNLDMEAPQITNISTENGLVDNVIDLSFDVSDGANGELAFVRVDACHSEQDIGSITISAVGDNENYDLESCDSLVSIDERDITTEPDLISAIPSELSEGISNFSKTLSVNVGSDINGMTFYVTAMDKAGNYSTSEPQIIRFGDWAVVKDGLLFGNEGVTSYTRELQSTSWDETTSNISDEGFSIADNLDLTNQVLLGGETTSVGFLGDLVHSATNLSFKASNFSGVPITNVYAELINAYKLKQARNSDIFQVRELGTTENIGNTPGCDTSIYEYCAVLKEGDIVIGSDFLCDTKALISSGGNITITPDFLNETNANACILLANGDIIIQPGESGSNDINYDVIQSLLIAGNNIVIEEDPSNDGLIVEGGLIAFGSEDNGISNIIDSRTIAWGYRNSYPVIAVNNNAKYGLMSRDVFGSQIEIFKLEIGFKPY